VISAMAEARRAPAASVQDLKTSGDMVKRLGVDVPLLSDRAGTVARSFGIYDLPGSMGPFSTHSFWLIGKDGVIRLRQVSLEMHVPFDAMESAVQGLRG
jgi:peroxiredoxin